MKPTPLLLALHLFAATSYTLPLPDDAAVGLVWQFPNTTWIENLAVRHTGEILCTSLSAAAIFMVDPFAHTEVTVVQFEAGNGVLGITEVESDVFVVVTARVDLATSEAAPGSAAAWKVDMNAWVLGAPNVVTLVANLTDVGLPDGVVPLTEPDTVLIADAAQGLIWKLSTRTGEYTIVLDDDILRSHNPHLPLGVDGLHILDEYLYFTNLGDNIFARVAIDTTLGNATDQIEIVATLPFPDDFALAGDGTAYVVGANQLYRVSPAGKVDVLAGGVNDTTLEGATSATFGRTGGDAGVLYIGES
ncbi:hypothetical protein LTR53_005268 [Teratosphaeriaceae sp. CCFEE 6253]|nr:hypothetical protein LTR53_005268 [Teratosphaeriaceae sp. CCFEE 6253]